MSEWGGEGGSRPWEGLCMEIKSAALSDPGQVTQISNLYLLE